MPSPLTARIWHALWRLEQKAMVSKVAGDPRAAATEGSGLMAFEAKVGFKPRESTLRRIEAERFFVGDKTMTEALEAMDRIQSALDFDWEVYRDGLMDEVGEHIGFAAKVAEEYGNV